LREALARGRPHHVVHLHHGCSGKEYVDIELTPITDSQGRLECFIEKMNPLPAHAHTGAGLVGEAPAFTRMLDRLARVAPSDAAVLLLGVDSGIVVGLLVSLGAWIAGSGKPHIAEVGRIAGSEHFRNVARFAVERLPGVRFVRVDESLYFGNARNVDTALRALAADARVLVLIMSGVNRVDLSALMMLEALDDALAARGTVLWLSDVKGPVAGVLGRAGSDARFAGRTCLSANDAWIRLSLGADYQI